MLKILMPRNLHICLFCLAVVVLLAGCSATDNRQQVTGAVTVDGEPLELGAISFMPEEGLAATSSGATVRDGRFELPPNQGLRPGRYAVEVKAYRATDRPAEDRQMGEHLELEELQFNETQLEATIKAEGPNHFKFALTTMD
jgi:hypothetical protein